MQTEVPRIPHPERYLKRPVRIAGVRVGNIVTVNANIKPGGAPAPTMTATAAISKQAAELLFAGARLTVDGLPKKR